MIFLHPSHTLEIMAKGQSKIQQPGKFTHVKNLLKKSKERDKRGQDMRP